MKQGRGMLTDRIKEKSKELLGYEISTPELRLMAYTQYCVMNSEGYDRAKVNDADREVMSLWENKKFIKRNAFFDLEVTHEFWTAMNEILYLGYVDIDKD